MKINDDDKETKLRWKREEMNPLRWEELVVKAG